MSGCPTPADKPRQGKDNAFLLLVYNGIKKESTSIQKIGKKNTEIIDGILTFDEILEDDHYREEFEKRVQQRLDEYSHNQKISTA